MKRWVRFNGAVWLVYVVFCFTPVKFHKPTHVGRIVVWFVEPYPFVFKVPIRAWIEFKEVLWGKRWLLRYIKRLLKVMISLTEESWSSCCPSTCLKCLLVILTDLLWKYYLFLLCRSVDSTHVTLHSWNHRVKWLFLWFLQCIRGIFSCWTHLLWWRSLREHRSIGRWRRLLWSLTCE